MSSPAAGIPIEALVPLVRDAFTVNRSGVAATACLIYDIIITLNQEVEYIWRSAWTPPKLLYIFSRYFALIVQIVNMAESTDFGVTDKYCHDWTMFEGVAGQLIVMGVEVSLMLRVYALFKRDKRILALLIFIYLAEVTALTVILGLALSKIVSVAPLRGIFPSDFPLSGCFPVVVPGYFFSYWIPSLIFESVLFILMTVNFVRYSRQQKPPMPLLTQFFRDGTVYYAVIFVTLLTNVLLYQLVNSALAQVAIGWELTVFSIAGTRLILNLRASGFATRSPAGTAEVATLEMMRFDKNASPELLGHSQAQTFSDLDLPPGTSEDAANVAERWRVYYVAEARTAIESRSENSPGIDTRTRRDWISEWGDV